MSSQVIMNGSSIELHKAGCHTCELITRRDEGKAPPWDMILRTGYWDVVHSYNTSLPGWLVLVVRRHITAVADLTEAEAIELGRLIRNVSRGLQEVTGCQKTYIAQFAEMIEHPHVHFHIIPRMANQSEDVKGAQIFKLLGVPPSERVTEEKMNEIALRLRKVSAPSQEKN